MARLGAGDGRGVARSSARLRCLSRAGASPHPNPNPNPNLPPTLTLTLTLALTASVVQAAARGRSARGRSPVLGPSAGRSETVPALRDAPAPRREGEALPHLPHPMSGAPLASSSSSLVLEGSLGAEGLHDPAHHAVATEGRGRRSSSVAAVASLEGGGGVLHMPIFERLMQACTIHCTHTHLHHTHTHTHTCHMHMPHATCHTPHAQAHATCTCIHIHMHMHIHMPAALRGAL